MSQAAARGQDRKKETSGWLVTAVWCRGRIGGGGGNWTKQPIILTVELRWLGRAAWADTGIIFAAGSSPAQLPGTGGGGTIAPGTGQGQYTRIKMIQSDTRTQLVTATLLTAGQGFRQN